MCAILVSISDIVTGIFILIDCCRPIDTGLSASGFVKCMKCLTGLSLKNDPDLDEYRLFTIRWLFLPSSTIVLLWNIAEACMLYEDKPKDTVVFMITYILVSFSLLAMILYIFALMWRVTCMLTKELDIAEHRLRMILYHILDMFVDVTLLIAACSYTPVDPGLKSRFAVFIYSICDIILSFSQLVKIAISIWISRSGSIYPNN